MNWISVDDQLPECKMRILFTCGGTTRTGVFIPHYSDEDSDLMNVFKGDDKCFLRPDCNKDIHWMRLPELP